MAKLATTGSRTTAQPVETILALIGHFLIIAKLEDHDIRAPILGMGREVAISRRIPVLVESHDEPSRPSTDGSAGSASRSDQLRERAG